MEGMEYNHSKYNISFSNVVITSLKCLIIQDELVHTLILFLYLELHSPQPVAPQQIPSSAQRVDREKLLVDA